MTEFGNMDKSNIYSFQVDAPIVRESYKKLDNFLIEDCKETVNMGDGRGVCAIYFSGNSIYYPNDEATFRYNISNKNRFEWFGLRYPNAQRHIFIRDIFKQWYLGGINEKINSLDLLLVWLKERTIGYRVVAIGSSAGGYAAVMMGCLLNAERVFAFSPRLEMNSLLLRSNPFKAPLFFRYYDKGLNLEWMDFNNKYTDNSTQIYCFYPEKSDLDRIQLSHIKNTGLSEKSNIHIIYFSTNKHGVPFPKIAVKKVFSLTDDSLIKLSNHTYSPYWFTIKLVGFIKGNIGIIRQTLNYIKKRMKI